jgi:hypothetical protein
MEVPPQKTPLTEAEVREAFRAGHELVHGTTPPEPRLAYAWAVAMLETGRGRSTWNYNFGNVKATASWKESHDWTTIPVRPPEPPEQRAFATAAEGAASWWRLLDGSRYAGVLELADQGQPYDAAWLMGERGYYTAPKDHYSGNVQRYVDEYREVWPYELPAADMASRGRQLAVLLLGAFAGWSLVSYLRRR